MIPIIDTQCHYNLSPLVEEWQTHWQKAQEHGVTHTVIVGTEISTSMTAVEQASQEANVYATLGIHPFRYEELVSQGTTDQTELNLKVEHDIRELADLIEDSQKVVALGETGLDYFRLPENQALKEVVKKTQAQAFIGHIHLAEYHKLPLIIHVRDQEIPEVETAGNAYWDTLNILKNHHSGQQNFILHCVSGPVAYVKAAVKLGAFIGIAGNVTYKKADHIRSLVNVTPVDRLLLETDAPFLPPQEFRGKICEPWMISHTAEFVADMGISTDQIYQNSKTFFGI